MEAIFKIQAAELDEKLFLNIKRMFEGKRVTITITTELDETGYLSANPANRKHLLESIASEPTVNFTPEEFNNHVESLQK
jgi:hypothetical protein